MVKFKQLKKVGKKVQMTMIAGLMVAASFPFMGTPNVPSAKAAGLTPGATPDYFQTPNYANSQLPEIDPVTKQIIPGTGIRKFVDGLPGLGAANKNNLGQYIPVAVPDTTTYPGSDYYEISLVEYTEQMHSDLKPTKLRGYVQTNTTDPSVSKPNYLGPMIIAQKNRPVRVKFTNKLPTGSGGDLFLPVDESLMGAGAGPNGGKYTQNRGLLHLHGGITPWISDGTPHQWITPAGENTPYPKGVSVKNVPDMPDPGDGSMTYFYTNQQSARMLFYHDHSYGITRLNVYAGEEAGYLLRDQVEQDLIDRGIIPKDEIPLMIQDKTFVPTDNQLAATDPTWDTTKWGGQGNLWFPHVYMPNQNPYDLSGANPMGRWDYGPWFWPPNTGLKNGPVPNPLYGKVAGQPQMNPGTPNVSAVPEAFMDTPVINGTAYPTLTVDPKAYRFRILNAANDRMWNLQLYKAKSSATMWNADGTLNDANAGEVPMVDAVRKTGYPATWPTDGRDGGVPDPTAVGPEMIQIGNDSGLLPKPAVLANQPVDFEYGRRSITVLNVSSKTLLLGPAERADVVVDFSKYAGQTLILYNDGPAPVPAFDPRYDYYTGDPDQSVTGENTGGAPTTLPGYGPNTRTIMQIKVAANPNVTDTTQATINNLNTEIPKAFKAGQNPLIFPNDYPTDPNAKWVNIQDNSTTFTPPGTSTSLTMPIQPKAIAEEFEQNYGRMNATLGVELPNTNFQNQTTIMLGYIDPSTENLTDSITPMSPKAGDGTQIWKITHNGVDTHAIHFHLFDVQLINRVGWDGSIRFPDENEKGWKDTVRMNPLEDCIVALRPVSPKLPFAIPDSIRLLDPTMPAGSTMGFMGIDPTTGNPMTVTNKMTNFGWEYVWHCHLLGHEENDMMRTMIFHFAQVKPNASVLSGTRTNGGPVNLSWTDPTAATDAATLGNPANEIGFNIMRATITNGKAGTFTKIGTSLANSISFTDNTTDAKTSYAYRVDAYNAASATNLTDPNSAANGGTPSNIYTAPGMVVGPTAPTNLTAVKSGSQVNLSWTDNASDETGFTVERSTNGVDFTAIGTIGARTGTGRTVNYTDSKNLTTGSYTYRVNAYNANGPSAYSITASITFDGTPIAPTNLSATILSTTRVSLSWKDNATNETGFKVELSINGGAFTAIATPGPRTNTGNVSYNDSTVVAGNTYTYRVSAVNGTLVSGYSNEVSVSMAKPETPINLKAIRVGSASASISWSASPNTSVTQYNIQYATNSTFTQNVKTLNVSGNNTSTFTSNLGRTTTYYFRIQAVNIFGSSAWSSYQVQMK